MAADTGKVDAAPPSATLAYSSMAGYEAVPSWISV